MGVWRCQETVCSFLQARGRSSSLVMSSICLSDFSACAVMLSWTYTHLSLTPDTNNNTQQHTTTHNNTPPRLAGLTYRWGSVAVGEPAGEAGCQPEPCTSDTGQIITCLRQRGRTSRTPPSEMKLASLEPETLLAWCGAFFRMAQREALGWSCTGLGVTVAAVLHQLWRRRQGGAGYVWLRAVDVFL